MEEEIFNDVGVLNSFELAGMLHILKWVDPPIKALAQPIGAEAISDRFDYK